MDTVLAIDLGGSSLRAALVARDGKIVASVVRHHVVAEEADAEGWWDMLVDAVSEIRAPDDPASRVRAIVATGFTRSQVLVDDHGRPVRPAQCFPDTRATAEAAELAAAPRGTWMEMTAFHPAARLRWAQAHDPEAFARTHHVLQPKDYLVSRLTGRQVSDRISNAWALERRGNVRALSQFLWADVVAIGEPAPEADAGRREPLVGSARPVAAEDLDDASEDELEAMLASRLGGKR